LVIMRLRAPIPEWGRKGGKERQQSAASLVKTRSAQTYLHQQPIKGQKVSNQRAIKIYKRNPANQRPSKGSRRFMKVHEGSQGFPNFGETFGRLQR